MRVVNNERKLGSVFAPRRREFLALISGAAASQALGLTVLAEGTAKKGGVLKVAAPANPSSLDPVTGGSGADHPFLYTIFDTLIEWDYESLRAKPGLAESWQYPDPNTLVLNLRQGVVFHDGTPCNAEAVKFNLDRIRQDQRSNLKADVASVESVEISGPSRIALKLKRPDTALPLILSDRAGMIASPNAIQELGKEHDRKPVGTGAWKIVTWADNDRVVVTRNENYWKPGLPYLDGIEFAIIPEVQTGLRSVIGGQNDYVYFLAPQLKPIADRAKNLVVVSGPTLYCLQLYFNWSRPPLNDTRVRQAINYAIDRQAFVKATMGGIAQPAAMDLPIEHWAYDQTVARLYRYDPEKAQALLAEAGYKDGLDINMVSYTDQLMVQKQEVIIEQLRKVGINVKFTNGTIAEMSAAFFGTEKKGEALLSAWTGRPDPSLTYSLMFSKDAYYNAGRAEPPAGLAEALDASRREENINDRKRAFATVQRLVMENALVAPLCFQYELDAMTSKVKGYRPNLLGKPKFEDVYLEG
ncbi:MAG TPA: ABC transporter substrate-binding protein [Xanthobacteraceae bacterium]|nr:ABC transporter substrate-binding protein [Xanthobacteraceae bacterium]